MARRCTRPGTGCDRSIRALSCAVAALAVLTLAQGVEYTLDMRLNNDGLLYLGETSLLTVTVGHGEKEALPAEVTIDGKEAGGRLRIYRSAGPYIKARALECSDEGEGLDRKGVLSYAATLPPKGTLYFALQPCKGMECAVGARYRLAVNVGTTMKDQMVECRLPIEARPPSDIALRCGETKEFAVPFKNVGFETLWEVELAVENDTSSPLTLTVPSRLGTLASGLERSETFKASAGASLRGSLTRTVVASFRTTTLNEENRTKLSGRYPFRFTVACGTPRIELAVLDPLRPNEKAPSFQASSGSTLSILYHVVNAGDGFGERCNLEVSLPKSVFRLGRMVPSCEGVGRDDERLLTLRCDLPKDGGAFAPRTLDDERLGVEDVNLTLNVSASGELANKDYEVRAKVFCRNPEGGGDLQMPLEGCGADKKECVTKVKALPGPSTSGSAAPGQAVPSASAPAPPPVSEATPEPSGGPLQALLTNPFAILGASAAFVAVAVIVLVVSLQGRKRRI